MEKLRKRYEFWRDDGGMSLTLTPDELKELTGKCRPHAQARVLDALDIPYRRRPDGSLIVLRGDITNETEKAGQASPELHL